MWQKEAEQLQNASLLAIKVDGEGQPVSELHCWMQAALERERVSREWERDGDSAGWPSQPLCRNLRLRARPQRLHHAVPTPRPRIVLVFAKLKVTVHIHYNTARVQQPRARPRCTDPCSYGTLWKTCKSNIQHFVNKGAIDVCVVGVNNHSYGLWRCWCVTLCNVIESVSSASNRSEYLRNRKRGIGFTVLW